ncbi:MAG: class F sortase [Propionibacteriales bacterium]|nr:class F sortase [Propionibacteriales bacterium]
MSTHRRLVVTLVLCLLTGLLMTTATTAAADERLGPGHSPQPHFSGYTTRSGHDLGIARLPGGPIGVCLDTGSRIWPERTGRATLVTDPVVGYLLSAHLDRARRDGIHAAALWWAVGRLRGLNSQPARMRSHLAEVRRESPRIQKQIVRRARAMVTEARRYAAPRKGYAVRPPVLHTDGATGSVSGLGLRSATGRWTPGIVVTVTLRGARLSDGRSTRTFRTGASSSTLTWKRTAGRAVSVRVRYSRVPHHRYRLYRSGGRFQRVAASAGLRILTTGVRTGPLATPSIYTRVNLQRAQVGATLMDSVNVIGTRGAALTGEWLLIGPVAPAGTGCAGRTWDGAPVAGRGTFRARGDGTYDVGSTRVHTTGCYTYRERLHGSATTIAVPWTPAGLVEETSQVRSRPVFHTRINRQRAVAGAVLSDKVVVTGVPQGPGATALTGQWQLLGPVSAGRTQRCRGARWAGAPIANSGTFTVRRDGAVTVGRTRIRAGGCYSYRERIAATLHSEEVPWSKAGLVEETSLALPAQPSIPKHPQVDTGGARGTPPTGRLRAATPQVRIPGLLVADLQGVAFHRSTLPAPYGRSQAGLWTAGAPLSEVVGTTVITGHVSDNSDRPAAFHALRRVRVGQQVQTRDAAGHPLRWRVVKVRSFDRRNLPRGLFAQRVHRRLVLITCSGKVTFPGGFHYRRNLVVEAEQW